jgi:hypothetical protein
LSINDTFQKLRVNPKFQLASVAESPQKSKRLHKDWAGAMGFAYAPELVHAIF